MPLGISKEPIMRLVAFGTTHRDNAIGYAMHRIPEKMVEINFQLQKHRQNFIRSHDETLAVVAMRVSNPDRAPLAVPALRHSRSSTRLYGGCLRLFLSLSPRTPPPPSHQHVAHSDLHFSIPRYPIVSHVED